jgi:hypothetical protein
MYMKEVYNDACKRAAVYFRPFHCNGYRCGFLSLAPVHTAGADSLFLCGYGHTAGHHIKHLGQGETADCRAGNGLLYDGTYSARISYPAYKIITGS